MKKYYILSALLMLAACENQTEEFFEPIIPETKLEGVVMSIPQYVYEAEEMTRTTITPTSEGMSFAWKEGDKVGVYATSSMANFDIKSINEDATSATFDGGGFSLTSGSTYYAFYPYNGTATEKTAVPVNYLGQEQLENGSYSHLSEYDYMVATATATATDEASFNFAHLGSIMRFKITVPEPGVYKSLVVKSTDSDFVEEGNVDLTASLPIVVLEGSSDKLVLSLGENSQGISLTEDNLELTAYILTPPVDLSGKTLTVSIFNENDDEFSATVEGKNMQAGGAYAFNNIKIEGDKIPYVTFHAEGAQSLTMSKAVESLEYSVNGCPWTELGTTTVDFGGDAGDLRLRGKNPYGTTTTVSYDDNPRIRFSSNALVSSSGDLRTIVDYENYYDADCSRAMFCHLFEDCSVLTSAPDLPATVLARHCYRGMFTRCSSLESAPELPAKTLTDWCYYFMFVGCTKLSYIKMLATDISALNCISRISENMDWTDRCSATGTFVKSASATWDNAHVVPEGWTIKYVDENGNEVIRDETPYLTFHAEGAQSLTMSTAVETLEYSVNDGDWTALGTSTVTFGGNEGDLRLRGKSSYGTVENYYSRKFPSISFGNNTSVLCFGDIRTLVDYSNYDNVDCSNAGFGYLFEDCKQLISAPELPATTLAVGCYKGMFLGCTSLTMAPELPARTLAEDCYWNMFENCRSLTSAPELPAETLAKNCYYCMFFDCISLTRAPELPATTLADCYGCYGYMFKNCMSLTIAPELPATTLAENCYFGMFENCTSLTTVPELPATTLAMQCYVGMFENCASLSYIKMMATDISASSCLLGWMQDVAETGTFVKNAAATWSNSQIGIPESWTVLTATE